MRKKNRSFLLMSLLSASLLVSVFTIGAGPESWSVGSEGDEVV